LGRGVGLATPLPHAGGKRGRQPAGSFGGHRHDRAKHRCRTPRALQPPIIDELLGGAELARIDELDIRAQRCILGQWHRVVGPRAVDHCRRDEHYVPGVDGVDEGCGKPLHGALSALRTGIRIAGGEPDEHLGGGQSSWVSAGHPDGFTGREQPMDAGTQPAAGIADPNPSRRGDHAGDASAAEVATAPDPRRLQVMAEGDPAENPFANLPMFGDLAKALAGQGPLNWDAARQFAAMAATGGTSEANVDPTVRIKLGDLARIVEMHVADVTGFEQSFPAITVVTPGVWAQRALDAYRPLFTEMATSLGQRPTDVAESSTDPMMAMMAGLSQMMAPAMMGMAIGSMVGRMGARAFGQYDLPIPRNDNTLLMVPATIDAFAAEWELPADEMRIWVIAQELIAHTLFAIEPLRTAFAALVRQHAGAFRPDPNAVAEKLAALEGGDDSDDPMQAIQQAFSDPALLLGAVQSPEQARLAPRLDAAVAAVVGYVDYLVDAVAARTIGGDALRIAEAVRRRRVESSSQDVYVQRLLGLQLDIAQVQRGKVFIAGVVDRIGEAELRTLFARPDSLPTPAELDAPGLWIARLSL
jgi:putative hydrolase